MQQLCLPFLSFSNGSAGGVLCPEVFLRQSQLLLSALDRCGGKVNLFLSAFAWDMAKEEPSIVERLLLFGREGRIEFLNGYLFEPASDLAFPEELIEQLALGREFLFKKTGCESEGVFLHRDDSSEELLKRWPTLPYRYLLSEVSGNQRAFRLGWGCKEVSSISHPEALIDLNAVLLLLGTHTDDVETLCSQIESGSLLSRLDVGQQLKGGENTAGASLSNQEKRVSPSSPARTAFAHRLNHFRNELAAIPQLIENEASYYVNKAKYADARRAFLRAQHLPRIDQNSPEFTRALRKGYQSLLDGQVVVDSIRHLDVELTEGWLEKACEDFDANGELEWVFDTPFLRFYFEPKTSSLVELDYKPRKWNLLSSACTTNHSFCGRLFTPAPARVEARVGIDTSLSRLLLSQGLMRANPDILVYRIVEPLTSATSASSDYKLYKDFTLRAGVGGFSAQATTGFSMEYWLAGNSIPNSSLVLAIEACFMLPSANAAGMSIRPLLCVGGEGERVLSLAEPRLLAADAVAGGLYGVRLIDGIENFSIDLRSSKAVGIDVVPLVENCENEDEDFRFCRGVLVRFISRACDVFGDEQAATVFVSV